MKENPEDKKLDTEEIVISDCLKRIEDVFMKL